ncbi:DUF1491 family protein [Sphingomonas sp. 28-63-12]|uniref:DUF1491 family protein n=1 Tax=Sphingomonas sp. 28-63-12 TaxID=1970434 RepID=UPI000BD3D956|nr:MAG: hypothetical protein B7Y47_05590 [Sphingomonas sp. 28-63-12]
MSDRLPSGTLIGALLRQINDAGGMAMVLAKGDPQAGAILVITCHKGKKFKVLERAIGPSGLVELMAVSGPAGDDPGPITDYWQRRRARDPDLWVVELDIADAERFAAETIALA